MTNLPDRPDRPDPRHMRASDADRDRAAQVLRDAAGDGRLTLEELDERLNAVYGAKTYAELEPITRDLPGVAGPAGAPVAESGAGYAGRIGGRQAGSRWAVGILSGFQRKGPWVVPPRLTALAFWGGGQLDLREALFAEREVTIRAFAVMGGVSIVVPHDMEVDVRGVGVMGGFDSSATGTGAPDSPRVVIKGFAFWGGVAPERKRRKRRKLAAGDDHDGHDGHDGRDGHDHLDGRDDRA